METEILSVTSFIELTNQTLEFALPVVVVEGEVSSFKINQDKWVFFDLKDDDSTVSCFMSVYQLKVALEDGMLVRVTASPKLTKWGRFSLTVRSIELSGEGSVKKAFELMRARFEAEGLFALERKRTLPEFPRSIGLVTSEQAAAYSDFLTIVEQRWPFLDINHAQVQVQGESAPAQICAAIELLNSSIKHLDVLVIVRGGGSIEDLQAFNHEDVVRAIYGSKIPTLVAIGHEDDVTLAELAADVRGATPSDAARLLVPEQAEITRRLAHYNQLISSELDNRLDSNMGKIENLYLSMRGFLQRLTEQLGWADQSLVGKIEKMTDHFYAQCEYLNRVLQSLNPTAVLKRGYSIASIGSKVLTRAVDIKPTDEVVLQLWQGRAILQRKQTKHDTDSQTRFKL